MNTRRSSLNFRFRWLLPLFLAAMGIDAARLHAQETSPTRRFERERYDLLKLKDTNKPLRILLLPPAERRGVDPSQRTGALTIRLTEAPDSPYEVAWASIERIDLFESQVLAEAEPLIEADKFDEAYEYFNFLRQEYPDTPGLSAAWERMLWREAGAFRKAGQHEQCYAMLMELFARNPAFDRLEMALIETTQSLLDGAIERQDFAVARTYAKALREHYPESANSGAAEQRLQELAAKAVVAARDRIAGNAMSEAYDQAELALRIWPDEANAKEVMVELSRLYPRVVVATTAPALEKVAGGFADQGAYRRRQLTGMGLVELRGYGADGTEYASEVAEIEQTELGRKLVITLRPGVRWSADGAELAGVEVAKALLACARRANPDYRPEMAELLAGVSVHDVYRVECDLTRPFAKPLALLEVELKPGYGERGALGAYLPEPPDGARRRFTLNAQSPPREGIPREILELPFPDGRQALEALRGGQITAVDRVTPWELAAVKRDQNLRVEPYATPTLHVLVPNRDRPLVGDRNFRRALVYAIDRQSMLQKLIYRGEVPPGNRVISGPFPAPASTDDPRGYAYNNQVEVRPYDPRLAMTLIGVARLAATPKAKSLQEAEDEAQKQVPLRMAIPASDVPRLVAKSLARQWRSLGIDLELVEYESDVTPEAFAVCDLVYRELMVREPVVEARRLLGSDGALGSSNAYLDLTLLKLLGADSSVASRDRLRELHRLAAEDATLIPLWQLVDHCAYHRSLEGVGSQPISLYQHVRDWRVSPRLSTGTP